MTETMTGKTPVLERKKGLERALSKIDATTVIIGITLVLTLLDFYSHPNGGVADLERRRLLLEFIGPLARHIGNFGFSAAAAISAVFMKHIGELITQGHKLGEKVVHSLFKTGIATLMALNGLVEIYPGNYEMPGDLSMGLAGILLGTVSTLLALRKARLAGLGEAKLMN